MLAEKVGLRTDIPPRLFRQLLMQASDVVQKRLLAQAKPETRAEIRRILAKVTDEVAPRAAPRNYTAALAAVRALHKERKLTEADIAEFASSGKYEETIAALATVCAVPVEVVDRLMSGERADPVLILARAAGFGWATVREIMNARPGAKPSQPDARSGAREFRPADRRHRPARGALLAGAAGHGGVTVLPCIAGPDPAIHHFVRIGMDARITPAHDGYIFRKMKYAGARPSRLAFAS